MYDQEVAFAKGVSKRACKIITSHFNSHQDIALKADKSAVTLVDQKVNQFVADELSREYPDDYFDGEEATNGNATASRVWVCDPIDGTNSFVLGNATCMFVLGLFVDEEEVLCVITNPITGDEYIAIKGQGAFKNGNKISVNDKQRDGAYIIFDSKMYLELPESIQRLSELGYVVTAVDGSANKVTKIAEGRAVGMYRKEADYHDVGVGMLLVEEAGGTCTTLQGEKLVGIKATQRDGFIFASPEAYADIFEAVNKQ